MGNQQASSRKGKGGGRIVAGPGAVGKQAAQSDATASGSRKEEVEAGVQHRKGLVFVQNQRYEDAMQAFEESLKFRRMLNQENTFEFAATSLNIAIAESLLDGGRSVVSRFEEAFKMLRDLKATQTVVYANGVAMLGRWHLRSSRLSEGIPKLREALDVLQLLPASEKGVRIESMAIRRDLAEALVAAGSLEEAELLCDALLKETAGDNLQQGLVLVVKARARLKAGSIEQARGLLQEAIDLFNKHVPDEPLWLTRQRTAVPLQAAENLLQQIV